MGSCDTIQVVRNQQTMKISTTCLPPPFYPSEFSQPAKKGAENGNASTHGPQNEMARNPPPSRLDPQCTEAAKTPLSSSGHKRRPAPGGENTTAVLAAHTHSSARQRETTAVLAAYTRSSMRRREAHRRPHCTATRTRRRPPNATSPLPSLRDVGVPATTTTAMAAPRQRQR